MLTNVTVIGSNYFVAKVDNTVEVNFMPIEKLSGHGVLTVALMLNICKYFMIIYIVIG